MRIPYFRTFLIAATAGIALSLQGCGLLVAGGAGAAGGYEASEHGYGVQSPVEEDTAGGYKPQNPITHDESEDESED